VLRLVEAAPRLVGAIDEAMGDTDLLDDTTRLFREVRAAVDALAALEDKS
jgi:hypothetical protein